jgi:hypothetical protein
MRRELMIRIATISAAAGLAAFPASPGLTQNAEPLVLAQMMHGDDKGMQGKDGQGGKGMQGQGMQHGQGMQAAPAMPGQMGGKGPGMMMGAGMSDGSMMAMMMRMMHGRMDDMAEYVEGRIAFLQAELRPTDSQMAAWHEFANVLRANGKRISQARAEQPKRTSASFGDRLDDEERWLSVKLEGVRALKPAYAKLYAVLDDKQKKTADDVMLMIVR